MAFIPRLCRLVITTAALLSMTNVFAAPGDLDFSYGTRGRAVVPSPIPGVLLQPNSFIQQADGKTVIVGWSEQPVGAVRDFVVTRLNSDGSMDTTFDGDGVAIIDFFGFSDRGLGITQQPDGKIVVVGVINQGFGLCMGAARLNNDGSLDPTFGTGGKVALTGPGTPSVAVRVAVQGDKLIVGGHYLYNDFIFTRLLSNGAVDPTFGNNGFSIVDAGLLPQQMTAMIAQGDGKVIAVGGSYESDVAYAMSVARIDANGIIDASFNGAGTLITNCIGRCQWSGVTQQLDGKLIFTGWNSRPGEGSPLLQQEDSIVERHNLDGSLDFSFANQGRLTTLFATAYGIPVQSGERATTTVVNADGKLTVLGRLTGRTYLNGNPFTAAWQEAVGRFNSDGSIDTTFGYNGFRTVPFALSEHGYDVYGEGMSLLSDGKLLLFGLGIEGQNRTINLARLSAGADSPGIVVVGGTPLLAAATPSATFTINRFGGSAGAVTVSYTTVQGSAIAGQDFTPVSGTVTWEDGEFGGKLIRVPVTMGANPGTVSKTFQFSISAVSGNAVVERSVASATFAPDSAIIGTSASLPLITPAQSVLSVAENGGAVNVSVSKSGAQPVALNYFVMPGKGVLAEKYALQSGVLVWGAGDTTSRMISIPLINNAVNSADESFTIVLASVSSGAALSAHNIIVNVTDDDPLAVVGFGTTTATRNEGDGSVTFNVSRSGATSKTIEVTYATANGTATAGSDYVAGTGTLTWAPSDPDTKAVTVTLLDDLLFEGADETFALNLTAPVNAELSAGNAAVTLVDNDLPPQVAFAVSRVKVNERAGTVSVTVTRTGASGLIHSVDFATRDGTARAGRDYVATSGTLTWLATDPDTKTITIPIIFKPRHEDNENFKVDLRNPTSGATLGLAECKVVITER